jgi:hypothetical protein
MGLGSLGLDPTPITGTDPNEATNRINLHTHTGNPGEGDQIDSVNVINTPAGDITADNTQAAINELNVLANLGRVHVPVRQTVLSGHTDPASGLPAFLVAGSGLSINILASSTPLIIAFAYNFNKLFGQIDFVKSIDQDIPSAWSALPANQTCYLYVDRNIDTGVLTYGYSLFAPAYQNLAPETPSTDQHWFDLNSYYMKRWNGTAWENKQRVFVGECTTDASSVTSVICYALRGRYDSGEFDIEKSNTYLTIPNLGLHPANIDISGYIMSDNQYRILNNQGRASSENTTGQIGGDIIWQEFNKIYVKVGSDRIHTSFRAQANDQAPNSATSGKARIIARRNF